MFQESKFANLKQRNYVYDLITGKPFKASLIYRASRDGWTPADFHRSCDGRGRTVTFFQSSKGFVCAGYTSLPWRSEGEAQTDKDAFLASLTKTMGVYRPRDPKFAVQHNSEKGPSFNSALSILKDPINGSY